MKEKVSKYIEEEGLIERGDDVLAGVSGGADSVCLLHLLSGLSKKMGFCLSVVHVEHGIRGEESRADEEFVTELCKRMGIPCRVFHVRAREYAAETRTGLEEAARLLRYECYREAAEEIFTGGSIKIALAHHAKDNAETVLFQMIRGSGLSGLSGMRPKRPFTDEAVIIRPLLAASRAEIEDYLSRAGLPCRTDSTNLDMAYSRNRIRSLVLPELTRINSQAEAHINRSARLIRQLSEYLNVQAEELKKTACIHTDDAVTIYKEKMAGLIEPLAGELLRQIMTELAGTAKDIESVHIEALKRLLDSQTGRSIMLPYGLFAERVYEGIKIGRLKEQAAASAGYFLELTKERIERTQAGEALTVSLPDGKMTVQILEFRGEMKEISKKSYTKWFDYDKIKDSLQIRNRKSGDYLVIDEAGHKKRLKSWFIDEKIPGEERGRILLLTEGAHVLWIMGKRISAGVKVSESTKRILEVRLYGGNYEENKKNQCPFNGRRN